MFLYEELNGTILFKSICTIKENFLNSPQFVMNSINQKFQLRDYQVDAIAKIEYIFNENLIEDNTLLFNMATGSGKTLLMATNILYLYEKGYRNFIFFVNQTAILSKTKDNFLNKKSSKYLFNDEIIYNGKRVEIQEVENFSNNDTDAINIKFSTIQKIHTEIQKTKENSINLLSLEDVKIVMLSDEAHHIKTSSDLFDEQKNWGDTVQQILKGNKNNILLEYTATIDYNNEEIIKHYKNKIIVKYDLKEFSENKYSKEIYLIKSDLSANERILTALIMAYYRELVAQYSNIFLKPVILIKSKSINQQIQDKENFMNFLENLSIEDITKIKNVSNKKITKAFDFFKLQNKTEQDLIAKLKMFYIEDNIKLINSQQRDSDTKRQEQLKELNTLEENNIRLIFTVDMLNEGWDVLNLFDIVRLDETDSATKEPITKDVQLIGRGCRYFPFNYQDYETDKRKFDLDLDNDLRILEEFFYHSKQNNKYIKELKEQLEKTGLTIGDEEQDKELIISLKEEFKKTKTYKTGYIFENETKETDFENKNLDSYNIKRIYEEKINLKNLEIEKAFEQSKQVDNINYRSEKLQVEKKILRKALNKNTFFFFNNLKKYIPEYKSINDFINNFYPEDEKHEPRISIKIMNIPEEQVLEEILNYKETLKILIKVLAEIEKTIKSNTFKKEGTKEFKKTSLHKKLKDKIIQKYTKTEYEDGQGHSIITAKDESLRVDISKTNWYIFDNFYGTNEEKSLIRFISDSIEELRAKYTEIYLIRNENICKIYDFKTGKATLPDFLLFLTDNKNNNLHYQLFIEPKGNSLLKNDIWKEEFLQKINTEIDVEIETKDIMTLENQKYKIIGLPFYNKQRENNEKIFINKFNTLLQGKI